MCPRFDVTDTHAVMSRCLTDACSVSETLKYIVKVHVKFLQIYNPTLLQILNWLDAQM